MDKTSFNKLICALAMVLVMGVPSNAVAAPPRNEGGNLLFTPQSVAVSVQWQMMRSRSQSTLAGTLTESYAVEWKLTPLGDFATVETPNLRMSLSWSASFGEPSFGVLMMTRNDLVRLLGMEQELPQDARVWQADSPVMIFIQQPGGRQSEPVFRFSDDNGTVVVRLSARVASKS